MKSKSVNCYFEAFLIITLCGLFIVLFSSFQVSYVLKFPDLFVTSRNILTDEEIHLTSSVSDLKQNQNDKVSFEQGFKPTTQTEKNMLSSLSWNNDAMTVKDLYVLVVRLPEINLRDPETRDRATMKYLKELSDLQDKFEGLVDFRIWIQPDFIPFSAATLTNLFHLGRRYELMFDESDPTSSFPLSTVSKYIARLYFFDTANKLFERDSNIKCFVSIPDIKDVHSILPNDVKESCNRDTKIMKEVSKLYTLNPKANGINVAKEHIKTVTEKTASQTFSSFYEGRPFVQESKKIVAQILRNVPPQMRWDFDQTLRISDIQKRKQSDLSQNANILSRLLFRNAFKKDVILRLVANSWNDFVFNQVSNKIVFVVEEVTHTVDTNGLELSNGDIIHFTLNIL